MSKSYLTIALPNKGRLYSDTISFLEKCGLFVRRDNERQYQSKMRGIADGVEVVFQRARDIPKVVGEGRIDLGITGYDIFCEMGGEQSGNCFSIFPDSKDELIPRLPFGSCSLVLAVPDHWVDIVSMSDLAELAITRKKENQILKVATEFPYLTQNHLYKWAVSYFETIEVYGAAESAPKMGSADLVADLKASGVTLTENRLKEIAGGEILKSSACFIASKAFTHEMKKKDSPKIKLTQQIIDRIDAHLNAKKYWLITANIGIIPNSDGDHEQQLKKALTADLEKEQLKFLGQRGPTIASVLDLKEHNSSFDLPHFFSISIQVKSDELETAITILRNKTGRDILISPLAFVYDNEPKAYNTLVNKLKNTYSEK